MKKISLFILFVLTIVIKANGQSDLLKQNISKNLAQGVKLTSKNKCYFDSVRVVIKTDKNTRMIKDVEVFSSDDNYKQQYLSFFTDKKNEHLIKLQNSLKELLSKHYPKEQRISLLVFVFNVPDFDDCDLTVSSKEFQDLIINLLSQNKAKNALKFDPIVTKVGRSSLHN